MDIINRKIKELFRFKSPFLRSLGLNVGNSGQYEISIAKKIESIKEYIKPLNLKLIFIDKTYNLERVEISYSGSKELNNIILDIKELMSEMNIKIVELSYNKSKIIIEL